MMAGWISATIVLSNAKTRADIMREKTAQNHLMSWISQGERSCGSCTESFSRSPYSSLEDDGGSDFPGSCSGVSTIPFARFRSAFLMVNDLL